MVKDLDSPRSITSNQLAGWLQWVGIDSEHITSLKRRSTEPFLFEDVFNLMKAKPNDRTFRAFLFDLYKLLPLETWPVSLLYFLEMR